MKKPSMLRTLPFLAALTGLAATFACSAAPDGEQAASSTEAFKFLTCPSPELKQCYPDEAPPNGPVPCRCISPAITSETQPPPSGLACVATYTDGVSKLASLGCTNAAVMAPTKGACKIVSQMLWACPNTLSMTDSRLYDIGAIIDPATGQAYPHCPGNDGTYGTQLAVTPCRATRTYSAASSNSGCVGNASPGWFIVEEQLVAATSGDGGGVPCAGGCAMPGGGANWPH